MKAILFLFFLLCSGLLRAEEPIKPIPRTIEYDRAKAALGKLLFFDPRLSGDGTVSCASCHDPATGGVDNKPFSDGVGGQKGGMNAPTVFNSVFNFRQFWNGRARDLKEQAAGPIHNPVEMNMSTERALALLKSDPLYRELFKKAYGPDRIRFDDAMEAVAEFEKALITPDARFDRYLRGEIALNEEEEEGYRLFKKLGCIACHNGVNIGGNSFQKLGVLNPREHQPGVDDLFKITGDPMDKNRFKVPSLRNVELTWPYFHDGSAATLEEAVRKGAFHALGYELNDQELAALKAFFHSLTGKMPAIMEEEE